MHDRSQSEMKIWSLFLILLFSLCISLLIGRYQIDIKDILSLFNKSAGEDTSALIQNILINIRLPRVLAAVFVGSALAVAGAAYQGIFKNPMVSPSLLGVSSGAGFGAALGIILHLSSAGVQIFSFIFGVFAVFIVYQIGNIVAKNNNKTLALVLLGIAVSTLFSALISLLKYIGDPLNDLPSITFWLMGSLSNIRLHDIILLSIPFSLGTLGLWIIKWRLNIMSFSDEEALTMGLSINKIRLIVISCATLLTASAVSISGMIGWIGLVVPHAVRLWVGNDYKYVIPASIAAGGIYLLFIDGLSRTLTTTEIPLGILTAVIGTPVFVMIMLKKKKSF